ncbi:sigma-54-dependent transcriptional regulator [candidate division KSB1 bacterium]
MRTESVNLNNNITALVIDDEDVALKSYRKILESEGYRVITADNGRTGLEYIGQDIGDLVIVDLKMPDIDGMELLKSIKSQYPGKPVIMITAHSTIDTAVEAIKLGAFDYLPKPFTPDELLLVVNKSVENKKLLDEIEFLRRQHYDKFKIDNIIGRSEKMMQVFSLVNKVAATESTVLIYGESGTGKEVIARAIHLQSSRNKNQFVPIDCSALSPNLLESELFGHVKGAFTGATLHKRGLFEIASGGSLFLDEISNISLEIQAKLLRVLETREYKPVGSSIMKKGDMRLISATNRDLKTFVEEGSFREDLFYRLNVMPIHLPPLRERKEDISLFAVHYLSQFTREMKKQIDRFSDEAMQVLTDYDWPGNVRELKNTIERLVIIVDESVIDIRHLRDFLPCAEEAQVKLPGNKNELSALKKSIKENAVAEIEKKFIIDTLERYDWNISKAARETGFQRPNFHALMNKYGIKGQHH